MPTDAELRAKETGKIIANIDNLWKNVDKSFLDVKEEFVKGEKRFDKIDKKLETYNQKANEEKIKVSELYTWYKEQKETKKFLFRTVVKKFIPVVFKVCAIVCAVSGVGYACFQ